MEKPVSNPVPRRSIIVDVTPAILRHYANLIENCEKLSLPGQSTLCEFTHSIQPITFRSNPDIKSHALFGSHFTGGDRLRASPVAEALASARERDFTGLPGTGPLQIESLTQAAPDATEQGVG
jgi:hypothetical protein